MEKTAVENRAYLLPVGLKLGQGQIPQGFDLRKVPGKKGRPLLTFPASPVIFRIRQRMPDTALAEEKTVFAKLQRELAVFKGTAVQKEGMPRLAQQRHELVHNPAVYTGKLILRPLANPGQCRAVKGKAIQLLYSQGSSHFQGSRGGQPCSGRDVPGKSHLYSRKFFP